MELLSAQEMFGVRSAYVVRLSRNLLTTYWSEQEGGIRSAGWGLLGLGRKNLEGRSELGAGGYDIMAASGDNLWHTKNIALRHSNVPPSGVVGVLLLLLHWQQVAHSEQI